MRTCAYRSGTYSILRSRCGFTCPDSHLQGLLLACASISGYGGVTCRTVPTTYFTNMRLTGSTHLYAFKSPSMSALKNASTSVFCLGKSSMGIHLKFIVVSRTSCSKTASFDMHAQFYQASGIPPNSVQSSPRKGIRGTGRAEFAILRSFCSKDWNDKSVVVCR